MSDDPDTRPPDPELPALALPVLDTSTDDPPKPGRGRPSNYTPVTVAKIEAALRAGNTRRAAAHYGGIGESTFFTWQANFRDFREMIVRAESSAEVGFVAVIAKAAQEGDWRAALEWLKRRRPDDWREHHRIEIVDLVKRMVESEGWEDDDAQEAVRFVENALRGR